MSLVRVSSYAHAPAVMSARAAFEQLRLANEGVLYLHGGWTQLVDPLEGKARAAGIAVRMSTYVSGIRPFEDGYDIEIEGAALRSSAVILAIAPAEAVQTAQFSDSLRAAAAQLTPVRAACLSVGLRKQPYPDRFFALGQDEPSYYSNHAHVAQGLVPEGGALVHAAFYIAPDEKPSRDVRQRLERLIELVQPEWRSYREAEHFLAMANVTHDLPTAARAGARAPVEIGRGLYLAGDWVGDEGLLSDAAFGSGKAAGLLAAAEARSSASQQSVEVSVETG